MDPVRLVALQDVTTFSVGLLPVAIGFAVLRYRLCDIDILIRRTVSYSGLIVTLGVIYAICVVTLEARLRSLTGRESTLSVTPQVSRRRLQRLDTQSPVDV